jgi:hypothetical protein
VEGHAGNPDEEEILNAEMPTTPSGDAHDRRDDKQDYADYTNHDLS